MKVPSYALYGLRTNAVLALKSFKAGHTLWVYNCDEIFRILVTHQQKTSETQMAMMVMYRMGGVSYHEHIVDAIKRIRRVGSPHHASSRKPTKHFREFNKNYYEQLVKQLIDPEEKEE